MTTFHNQPPHFGMILGNWQAGQGCTNVIGGKLTAGAIDASGSALFTFDPFISAPIVIATFNSGILTGSNNISVPQLTGCSVSNVYINIGTLDDAYSGATLGIIILGEQRL